MKNFAFFVQQKTNLSMQAVCCVPVSPLRASPSHKSEMISQLLFGEMIEIFEKGEEHWIRVRCLYDQYDGWMTNNHIAEPPYQSAPIHLTADWSNDILFNGQSMHLSFGSDLRGLVNGQAEWGKHNWSFKGNHLDPQHHRKTEKNVLKIASLFLNTPYLWGGRSVFGLDCSGYTQVVYKSFGLGLSRDSYQQASQGENVGFLQEAKGGDLAFFDNEEGKITHVGILMNEHEIIHASGKVRVDRIDTQGIVNVDTQERTHKLRIIKRYF